MPVIGTQQSPIKIITADTLQANFPPDHLVIEYAEKALAGRFKGHDFEFSQFGKITCRGKKQKLVKIHIHRPAEHRVNATDAATFECHLVHLAADDADLSGPKVVIGVFFHERTGAETPTSIKKLSEKLRLRSESQEQPLRWMADDAGEDLKINPNDFLPKGKLRDRLYHYQGSLTSGTFSEDVSWFVMESEIAVDPKHIKDLKAHAEQEARVVHAVDRRFVLRNFSV